MKIRLIMALLPVFAVLMCRADGCSSEDRLARGGEVAPVSMSVNDAGDTVVDFVNEIQKSPEKLKVLMIGNSFSLQMVPSMPPITKDLGLKLDICSMFVGGCSLERHWQNVCAPTSTPYSVTRATTDGGERKAYKGNIPSVLASEKWDVVTIQQASHFSWKSETYHPWGDNLVKYIREKAPQAKIVVHETWSYTPWDGRLAEWKIDQTEMYEKLHSAYADFAKEYGFDIIPTGTAVQLVRKELPVRYTENSLGGDIVGSCKFVEKDGKWIPEGDVFHMGHDGDYLQALVWTAKLFGADVTKCSYKPDKMTDSRATFLRQMAMKAAGRKGN